jgi:hypothetical protein
MHLVRPKMLSVFNASLRNIARRHGTRFVATISSRLFFGDTINANTDTMDTVLRIISQSDEVAAEEGRMQSPLRAYGSTLPEGEWH